MLRVLSAAETMDAPGAPTPPVPEGEGSTPRTGRLLEQGRSLARRRWFWPVVLLVGYLAQVAFRISLVLHKSYPSVHADEPSYLVLARVLAGRPATEMPVGSVIPGGYPALISPAFWIADDANAAYHLVMGINALLNALVFLVAYAALRRLDVRRAFSVLIATAVALMPPVTFYAEFVMSDTVLPVVLLCWLVTMHGWLSEGDTRRRMRHGVGLGLSAGGSMAVHDRGGVVVAVTAVVVLGALVLKWAPRRSTAAVAIALAVSALGAKLLDSWLVAQFKDISSSTVGTKVLDAVLDPALMRQTLGRTIGQFWYFSTSTWGFGALAIVACVAAVFSPRVPRASRIVAFSMVTLLFGIALAAAAGLPADTRLDNWVYARYLACLAPAFLLVGVTVLYRARTGVLVRAVAAAVVFTGVTAGAVLLIAGKDLAQGYLIPWALPDALFLGSVWTKLHVWRTVAGALIVLVACVLFRLAGGRRVVWAVAVSLSMFAAYATVAVTDNVAEPHSKVRKSQASGFHRWAGIKESDSLVMDEDADWDLRMAQAFEVYEGRVWTRKLKTGVPVPEEATVALLQLPWGVPWHTFKPEEGWKTAPGGWKVVKVNRDRGWVVWRRG